MQDCLSCWKAKVFWVTCDGENMNQARKTIFFFTYSERRVTPRRRWRDRWHITSRQRLRSNLTFFRIMHISVPPGTFNRASWPRLSSDSSGTDRIVQIQIGVDRQRWRKARARPAGG